MQEELKGLEQDVYKMREFIGKQKMQMAVLGWALRHKTALENAGLLHSLISTLDTALAATPDEMA